MNVIRSLLVFASQRKLFRLRTTRAFKEFCNFQAFSKEVAGLRQEGTEPRFDPRLHRCRLPRLQHPQSVHQLLRVPL